MTTVCRDAVIVISLQVFKDIWIVHQRTACVEATIRGELLLLHLDEAVDGGPGLHQELRLHPLQRYVPRNNSSDRLGHLQSLDKGSSDQSRG